jgi:hypothetical protein
MTGIEIEDYSVDDPLNLVVATWVGHYILAGAGVHDDEDGREYLAGGKW